MQLAVQEPSHLALLVHLAGPHYVPSLMSNVASPLRLLGTAALLAAALMLTTTTSREADAAQTKSSSAGALNGISCLPGECVAVGYGQQIPSGASFSTAWLLRSGGWTQFATPATSQQHRLQALACPVLGTCVAVGMTLLGRAQSGYSMELNSGSWEALALPAGTPALTSISCVSINWCLAVGSSPNAAPIEIWNGTTWTQSTAASAPVPYGLDAVSCTSETFCMAVGYSETTPLAESWNGSSWTVLTQSSTYYMSSEDLESVSCTGLSFCAAVGSSHTCCGGLGSIQMEWDGTAWTYGKVSAPSQIGLGGVSCSSEVSCLAVGARAPDDAESFPTQAEVELWNGTEWTILNDPRFGARSGLEGVSCTRPSWCAAVGVATVGTWVGPLAMRWNGSALARFGLPT